MADERKFKVYLSHSWWPSDVDLNLWVWERLAGDCDLVVDKPQSSDKDPPYYVSRLEELIRRCDLFVAILTFRENKNADKASGDHALKCSAGSLFEIRLAERARRPRLVLYERTTGFLRPQFTSDDEQYIPFPDRGGGPLPDVLDSIAGKIETWLKYVRDCRKPRISSNWDRSLILLPDSAAADTEKRLSKALEKASFETVERIRFEHSRDADLVHQIFSTRLMVADVSSEETRELYGIAHTLFVPTIRLAPKKGAPMFWILDGHPGGYQHDIVSISDEPWPDEVNARANAIFRVTTPLGLEDGRRYIKSRRYKGTYVFLSHNLRPENRKILEKLIKDLRDEQIDFFEYYRVNTVAIPWRRQLAAALRKTTLFVGLLADDYELSQVCLNEWAAAKRGLHSGKMQVAAYLVNGRTKATPLVGDDFCKTLDDPPEINAQVIFSWIRAAALGGAV
jgi:hypothetical protein